MRAIRRSSNSPLSLSLVEQTDPVALLYSLARGKTQCRVRREKNEKTASRRRSYREDNLKCLLDDFNSSKCKGKSRFVGVAMLRGLMMNLQRRPNSLLQKRIDRSSRKALAWWCDAGDDLL